MKSGTLSRARVSAGGEGLCFFGICLMSLVWWKGGALLLSRGEATIIVNNGGDSCIARPHPHTINFNVQRPKVH